MEFIWYICLVASTILIIRGMLVAIAKSHGKFRMGKALLYLLAATYIIYLPVYFSLYSFMGAIIGNLVNTIQIIPLEASYVDGYGIIKEYISIEIIFQVYLLVVGVLHCLLPIMSAMTAYTFVVHCMSNIKLRFLNMRNEDVYVFSEINEVAVDLALDMLKSKGSKPDFIFSGSLESKKEYHSALDKVNYYFLSDSIADVSIKTKTTRKLYFFNISKDEKKNLNDTIQLIMKYAQLEHELQRNIYIYLFSNEDDVEEMIDSLDKGILNIKIINVANTSAYKLLDEHPLYDHIRDHMISLLVVGLNKTGVEILRTAIWAGQLEGVKIKINAIDPLMRDREKELQAKYPEMFDGKYDINLWQEELRGTGFERILQERCEDSTYIVVCDGQENTDEDNIRTAMALRRFFYMAKGDFSNKPFIAVYIEDAEKHHMVEILQTPEANFKRKTSYDIVPFGGIEALCSHESNINFTMDLIAKNVHLTYEDIFNQEDTLDVDAAMERYNALEVKKKSNRANALHIRYKLWMLELDYTEEPGAEEVKLADYLDETYLQRLTVVEHDRWMAFMRSEGWRTATPAQVKAYQETGISKGRHDCSLLKMHPYICPFDELEARSEELGLPNSTVYDRELIARIDDILHDKWNVTGEKFRIICRNEGERL